MVRRLRALALALPVFAAGCVGAPADGVVLGPQAEPLPEGTVVSPVRQAEPMPADEVPCIDVDGDGRGRNCAAGADCDDFDPTRAAECGAPLFAVPPSLQRELEPHLAVDLPAACDDGTLRDCYGDPVAGPTPLDATCTHGLALCTRGVWSDCRIDGTFRIPAAAVRGAIIGAPGVCNPCDPTCFTATTYPTGPDLTSSDSSGVTYSGTAGGITLPASTGSSGGLTDTDGDGVPDVADAYPGDPTRDGTRELGGFYHTLPMGTTAPPDSLTIMTTVRTADVYFLMDTTGSMGEEIANLRSTLTSTIIPNITSTIPDAWFGVGHHDDMPCTGYGTPGVSTSPLHHDWAYEHMLDIQSSASAAQTAVNTLNLGDGWDWPEAQVPALWSVATGGGLYGSAPTRTGCPAGRLGYPCFRAGSIPIVILFTDAPYHNGPGGYSPYYAGLAAPTYATAVAALNAIGAKVIVVFSGYTSGGGVSYYCGWTGGCGYYTTCSGSYPDGLTHARAIATATGSVDSSGSPFVYTIPSNGTGLTTAVTTAIADLANYSRMDITLRVNDDPSTPTVDERNFVQAIATIPTSTSSSRCSATYATWFQQCLPGTNVLFDVTLGNSFVAATAVPQVFHFTIDELGNGTYVLGSTPVTIVVPPMMPTYPASGSFWRDYDSTTRCMGTEVPRWGTLAWTATYPAGTNITWELQTAPTSAGLATAPIVSFVAPTTASPINVGDTLFMGGQSPSLPFLRVTSVLNSSADRLRAPVLSGFDLTFECIPGM